MRNEARAVETEIKFAGYLEQQKKSIERLKAAESVAIPDWIEYSIISGLSREMRETLERIRPMTIGQASRIPGVTPAALTLVHVSIKLQGKLLGNSRDAKRHATLRSGCHRIAPLHSASPRYHIRDESRRHSIGPPRIQA